MNRSKYYVMTIVKPENATGDWWNNDPKVIALRAEIKSANKNRNSDPANPLRRRMAQLRGRLGKNNPAVEKYKRPNRFGSIYYNVRFSDAVRIDVYVYDIWE